jgi:hypothetical protein
LAGIKSPGTALWIIGMILLGGIICLLLMYYFPKTIESQPSEADSSYTYYRYVAPVDTFNEINEFIIFSKETLKPVSCKYYTQKGLIKLQSALNYLADRIDSTNDIIKKDLDTLDRDVAIIDTSSQDYFDELKPAYSVVVNTLYSIQILNYPDLMGNISDLQKTNNSLFKRNAASAPLNKIKLFYSEAASTLQQMKLD